MGDQTTHKWGMAGLAAVETVFKSATPDGRQRSDFGSPERLLPTISNSTKQSLLQLREKEDTLQNN